MKGGTNPWKSNKKFPQSCSGNDTAASGSLWELISAARVQAQAALGIRTQSLGCVWWLYLLLIVKRTEKLFLFFFFTDRSSREEQPREEQQSDPMRAPPNAMRLTHGHFNCHGPQADHSPRPQNLHSVGKLTWKHHWAKNHLSCF